MTPEGKVKKKIIDFLKMIPNIEIELRQAGGWNYKKGKPDVWFVYKGRHFEIETKAADGLPSALQLVYEQKMRAAGAGYWRGNSFDDFKNWFISEGGLIDEEPERDV